MRVNVSTTTRGAISFEVTVEENETATVVDREAAMQNALADSDAMVASLRERYQPVPA